MATEWSSETFTAEFKDLQASAMAVDCLGKIAVLAGKKMYAYVSLDEPEDESVLDGEDQSSDVLRIVRQSKWDVGCIQFNPHASHSHLFVTACNQRLEINHLTDKTTNPINSLKGHSRIISDVDWSPFDVNIVASCSVDSFTYLWDVREPRRPTHVFQASSGVYQVKWNKVTNNQFATTHEGDIRIWDQRKNQPLQYISAHIAKIHGLDWSPEDQNRFVTASQDGYVKLWDCTDTRRSVGSSESREPVRRARYTPFGVGLVTMAVPQLKRGQNSLCMWRIGQQQESLDLQPIHTFVGHNDVVLEFQWKKRPEGARDYHLVTWSRDQTLRIWRIEPNLQRLCGHDAGDGVELDLAGTSYNSSDSTLKEFHDLSVNESIGDEDAAITINAAFSSQALQQEFAALRRELPGLGVDQMDAANRRCRLTGIGGGQKITVDCVFPQAYPNGAPPTFQLVHSTLDAAQQSRVLKILNDTAARAVKYNNHCLESCFKQVLSILETLFQDERKSPESDMSYTQSMQSMLHMTMFSLGSFQDSSVPFPRTCGARFQGDKLVVFGVPAEMRKVLGGTEVTPKALSELAAFTQTSWKSSGASFLLSTLLYSRSPPTPSSDMSISDFFELKGRRVRSSHSNSHSHNHGHSHTLPRRHKRHDQEVIVKPTKKQQTVGKVKVYDMGALLPINKQLAQTYKLDRNDFMETCRHNQAAAAAVGRKDLVQLWSVLSTVLSSKVYSSKVEQDIREIPTQAPWSFTPCGRLLVKSLLEKYAAERDVQTLAMISSLFWTPDLPRPRPVMPVVPRTTSKSSFDYTPDNTDANLTYYQMGSSTDSGWSLLRQNHSASTPEEAVTKNKRSMSWSDAYDTSDELVRVQQTGDSSSSKEQQEEPKLSVEEQEKLDHDDNIRVLDPNLWEQYDQYKLSYASMLYRWQLFNQRTLLLKYISTPTPQHRGVEFGCYCHKCGKEIRGPQCGYCKYPAFQCVICHLVVKGLANFCLVCGHGGHTQHMKEWFQNQIVCPTGCGCRCMNDNSFSTSFS